MIFYDGIIYSLQSSGGITVLFNEILSRLSKDKRDFSLLVHEKEMCSVMQHTILNKARFLERYRDVPKAMTGIFHSTYYRLPQYRNGDCKVVTTVHDYTYERFFKGVNQKVHSWQKNRAIQNSDRVICVSESTARDAIEFSGVRSEDISVIYNGVSSDYTPLGLEECSSPPFVIFVGSRVGYKNFKASVVAISLHTELTLLCVGGGGFTHTEISLLEKFLPSRYRHAGFVTNDQLNYFYNEAILLLYPSMYEGFGIPVLEAMAAGCPVIAVNASSIPEVAGDSALLIETGTVDEIYSAISVLLCRSQRDILISRGLLQAKKFSWDATYTKTLALYEDILGKKLA